MTTETIEPLIVAKETETPIVPEPKEKKAPKRYTDLNKAALVEAANYYGTRVEGTNKELVDDLIESGVTWEVYAAAFVNEPEPEPVASREVQKMTAAFADELVVDHITTAKTELDAGKKYLIKFVGANPYFEEGRHSFTQKDPYAIMNATEANQVLRSDPKKFRQAFPDELEEFYG